MNSCVLQAAVAVDWMLPRVMQGNPVNLKRFVCFNSDTLFYDFKHVEMWNKAGQYFFYQYQVRYLYFAQICKINSIWQTLDLCDIYKQCFILSIKHSLKTQIQYLVWIKRFKSCVTTTNNNTISIQIPINPLQVCLSHLKLDRMHVHNEIAQLLCQCELSPCSCCCIRTARRTDRRCTVREHTLVFGWGLLEGFVFNLR
jgi:hypothetical protein